MSPAINPADAPPATQALMRSGEDILRDIRDALVRARHVVLCHPADAERVRAAVAAADVHIAPRVVESHGCTTGILYVMHPGALDQPTEALRPEPVRLVPVDDGLVGALPVRLQRTPQ